MTVQLTEAQYWRLRAAYLQEKLAAAEAKIALSEAASRRVQTWDALAQEHGFDPASVFTLDDKAMTLVEQTSSKRPSDAAAAPTA